MREIQSHLQEMYAAEVAPCLISSIMDTVSEEVKVWRPRPLDAIYPIVYLDCIDIKMREGAVRVKAVYLVIGITMQGEKEALGLWLVQTESASSDARSSPNCATVAYRTSSLPVSMSSKASPMPLRPCFPTRWRNCASCTRCATA